MKNPWEVVGVIKSSESDSSYLKLWKKGKLGESELEKWWKQLYAISKKVKKEEDEVLTYESDLLGLKEKLDELPKEFDLLKNGYRIIKDRAGNLVCDKESNELGHLVNCKVDIFNNCKRMLNELIEMRNEVRYKLEKAKKAAKSSHRGRDSSRDSSDSSASRSSSGSPVSRSSSSSSVSRSSSSSSVSRSSSRLTSKPK